MLLGIDCSPGPAGRTATAIRAIMQGSGGTSQLIRWSDVGTDSVVEALSSATGIVLGAPVYRARACWVAKEILDFCPRGGPSDGFAGPLTGTPTIVVTTGASDHHHLASAELATILIEFYAAWVVPPPLHFTHADYFDDVLTNESAAKARSSGQTIDALRAALKSAAALRDVQPQV